ncbi:MAG TPA: ChbG/HpnK family deacetylase [Bryobacteraceae bacterium]|nr:ChbG/HpnK family deacetylase [Bryobacteraceae bacterium]
MRQLIVNADDFGFTRDVNQGIVQAYRKGILTATTLMANGDAFDDAVELARANADLDIGCHLVLIGGRSLASGERLPEGIRQLATAVMLRRLHPYEELRPQVERILSTGIRPTHLDSHKHTHLLPRVLDAVCRISEEFGIPWIRRPFDFPISGRTHGVPVTQRLVNHSMRSVRGSLQQTLQRHGCRMTDHFAGFQFTGRFRAQELLLLFPALPEGTTEFMCHPGVCTDELRAAPTRLKESREEELRALTDPAVRDLLQREGVQLTSFRQLP